MPHLHWKIDIRALQVAQEGIGNWPAQRPMRPKHICSMTPSPSRTLSEPITKNVLLGGLPSPNCR